jgi:alkanesulfonate monooxygenase SsuD/methylene tetrahydromethanopterin reductase-like flavin-dependent oxidoreductase (luciferase family)
MDLGVVIGGELPAQRRLARQVEEAGFESVWVAETARSAFVQAAVASSATARVQVGTDIALAFPRSPTITAMTARDLAELSGGRFILGLGTQVKRVNEQRFGVAFEHPAPKIAEAVEPSGPSWAPSPAGRSTTAGASTRSPCLRSPARAPRPGGYPSTWHR